MKSVLLAITLALASVFAAPAEAHNGFRQRVVVGGCNQQFLGFNGGCNQFAFVQPQCGFHALNFGYNQPFLGYSFTNPTFGYAQPVFNHGFAFRQNFGFHNRGRVFIQQPRRGFSLNFFR